MKKKTSEEAASSLGNTLRETVRATGLPVATIAAATGIPQPVLHRFMAGERDLRLATADKLCHHFGLELQPAKKRK